jgi:hypothetical protein
MFPDVEQAWAPGLITGLVPPDSMTRRFGVDHEFGSADIVDVKLRRTHWSSRLNGETVEVSPDRVTWFPQVTVAGISPNITFSFDGLMRPLIAYQLGAGADTTQRAAYLYWYDPTAAGYVHFNFGSVVCPFLSYDYPVNSNEAIAEVILWYIVSGEIRYRRGRDRFTIEYTWATLPAGMRRITGCGLGKNWRYHIRVGQ